MRPEPGLFVTLFTDASYCSDTEAYGWAAWAKYGDPAETLRVSGGGVGLAGSSYAETIAIKQGVKRLIDDGLVSGKRVVISSDCMGAINSFDTSPLLEAGAITVRMKHVKAHRGMICPRSAVNTWCDKQARREMRTIRNSMEVVE